MSGGASGAAGSVAARCGRQRWNGWPHRGRRVGKRGSGGSSGAGGTSVVVDAGPEAGPVGICNYANPITLLYRWWPTDAGTSRLDFSFKLVNGSAQAIRLDTITARYYLTNEIATPATLVSYGDLLPRQRHHVARHRQSPPDEPTGRGR